MINPTIFIAFLLVGCQLNSTLVFAADTNRQSDIPGIYSEYEVRISEFVENLVLLRSQGNSKLLGEQYSENGDLIVYDLPRIRGREAIANLWKSLLANPQEIELTASLVSMRLVADDVILANLLSTTSSAPKSSEPVSLMEARETLVISIKNAQLLIEAHRIQEPQKRPKEEVF